METNSEDTKTQDWSKGKKITIFALVGLIIVLSLSATFIPTAREYVVNIVKIILEGIKLLLN